MRARLIKPAFTALVVLAFGTACGTSSSGGSQSADSTSSAASSSALTGSPVVLGFMDIEGNLGIDFSKQRKVAQQTVDTLNSQGGIGGHPISLDTCITQAASGGADCANRFVRDKASVVLSYSTIDTNSIYPILKNAGIPLIGSGNAPTNASDFAADGNHFFLHTGAIGGFTAMNATMVKQGVKSLGLLVGTSSAAQQAATNLIKNPLEKQGIKTTLVQVSESNPDYTAAANAVSGTDALEVLLACPGIDSAVKQIVGLGYTGKVMALSCVNPSDLQAMGSAAKGIYGDRFTKPVDDPAFSKDDDVKAFLTLAKRYGWEHSELNELAYQQVMVAKAMVEKAGGPTATGQQIAAALQAASNEPLPLGPTNGLNCAGQPVKLIPSSCNGQALDVRVGSDGKTVTAQGGFHPLGL